MSQPTSNILNAAVAQPADEAVFFDDTALVDAARKGDMRSFGLLVAKHQDRLYNAVLRMCGDRDEAADICQEAFLRALRKIAEFRGRSQFYTWLFRIAVNLLISQRRKGGAVKFASLLPDPDLGDSQAAGLTGDLAARREIDPAVAAANQDIHRRVLESLEALDDEFRVVIVLRDIEDMDYQQMARILALPVGTVKSRLHRARCMLKTRLGDLVDHRIATT